MQVSNFDGTYQRFLWLSLWKFYTRCIATSLNHGARKLKSDQKLKSRGGAPPLRLFLVIFGRRALIFFFGWKLLEKMKNDTTFVRMRSGDHLGDAKMSKKGTSLRRI